MPATSTAKNPKGIEITFTESNHKYSSIIDGNEITYISGTTIIGKYFPEFDPTGEITARCAKKEGLTVEALKEKWSAKGKESCRLGTRTHEVCEDIELGRPVRNTPEDIVEEKRFANAIKMATSFKQKIDILGVEKIVFDETLKIAGTIDLFAKSRKDGSYLIIDHKTNKKIETYNTFKKFAYAPIEHVPDTSFGHYSLLLNLYLFILKYAGYIPKNAKVRMFLNHITDKEVKLIELPDMLSEIKDIIIDYILKIKTNSNLPSCF